MYTQQRTGTRDASTLVCWGFRSLPKTLALRRRNHITSPVHGCTMLIHVQYQNFRNVKNFKRYETFSHVLEKFLASLKYYYNWQHHWRSAKSKTPVRAQSFCRISPVSPLAPLISGYTELVPSILQFVPVMCQICPMGSARSWDKKWTREASQWTPDGRLRLLSETMRSSPVEPPTQLFIGLILFMFGAYILDYIPTFLFCVFVISYSFSVLTWVCWMW